MVAVLHRPSNIVQQLITSTLRFYVPSCASAPSDRVVPSCVRNTYYPRDMRDCWMSVFVTLCRCSVDSRWAIVRYDPSLKRRETNRRRADFLKTWRQQTNGRKTFVTPIHRYVLYLYLCATPIMSDVRIWRYNCIKSSMPATIQWLTKRLSFENEIWLSQFVRSASNYYQIYGAWSLRHCAVIYAYHNTSYTTSDPVKAKSFIWCTKCVLFRRTQLSFGVF